MVCVLCRDFLFGSLVTDVPGASNIRRVAALICGHTFHLDCITSWLDNDENTKCPLCGAYPVGSILALFIKCDMNHVAHDDLIDDSLLAIEQQDGYCKELETKVAALKITSRVNVEPLREIHTRLTEIHKNIALLDFQEKEQSTLSESLKSDIQSSLELATHAINELKKRLSEHDAEPAE